MAFTLFLLLAISTHLCFSQIVTGSHGSMPHEYNAIMERFQLRGNRTDHILRRPSNMQCITHSEEDRLDCDEDWKDRLEDDLNDREECCAFVRYRNCIKEAFEDEDSCSEGDVEIQYELWRNATDIKYPVLARRCWDEASDSAECIFLNNMALWICFFVFLVIFMFLFCAAFFYLLLVGGSKAFSFSLRK